MSIKTKLHTKRYQNMKYVMNHVVWGHMSSELRSNGNMEKHSLICLEHKCS